MADTGDKKADETRDFRIDKTLELIDKYKTLIDKIFDTIDMDLLGGEIDKVKDSDSEKKILDKCRARRQALEEVEVLLGKIENLEATHLRTSKGEVVPSGIDENLHPSKRHSRN